MHRLLKRQLQRHLSKDFVPHGEWQVFLQMLSSHYHEVDQERALLENALEVNSQELSETNERLRAQSEQEHVLLRGVIDSIPDLIFFKTWEGVYLGCNRAFEKYLGLPESAIVGKTDFDFMDAGTAASFQTLDREMLALNQPHINEEWITYPDASRVCLEMLRTPYSSVDGKLLGLIGIGRDVTERKQAEAEIHHMAFYDALTQLPNRRLLMDRLHQALAISARNGYCGAVLFIDLDHFKTLNDTKGHGIGDLLLIEVATRLKSCLRDGDTVSRLGGDEFVVVLETLSTQTGEAAIQAELVAEKIRAVLDQSYQLKEHGYHITPSIGIVMFSGHLDNLDDLLRHADIAMYQAKKAGRNAIRFYEPAMQAAIEARADLEVDLRHALTKQQFRLHYQIQVDSLRRPLGAEALLRWEHPERGLVSPDQFIQLAEETGIILPIGQWVLEIACAELSAWQHDALARDLTLAVNVSARQFRQADFVTQVQHVLQESGAKPSQLKLELTESTVLENVNDTITKMRELKQLGVGFSMDDFGTGYSSLQYLKVLPLDQLKIDQSFVRDITSSPDDAAIVQAIIAMSTALKLNVIAEGVETEAQCEFLHQHGCHAFQGYLFSKPVPLDEFTASLKLQR